MEVRKPETTSTLPLRVVIVGHVDHGKSTFVGRLLYETGSLQEDKITALRRTCENRGMPFEWAFVLDALQAERDQGITIDTTQIWFKTAARNYVLIDAPGHREFLKNMVSGAAGSDAAFLIIDAREGVREQSRRHAYLLHLLNIRQVVVLINKMDLVAYSAERYEALSSEIHEYLSGINIKPLSIVPISAREGEGIAAPSQKMPWYRGPAVVGALDSFPPPAGADELPLRFPVQDVYKFDDRRIVAGRIESGALSVGDQVVFSPSNKSARVASIEAWHVPTTPTAATAGHSIGITLDDEIFVERGEIISHLEKPPIETNVFRANLFWLGKDSLYPGKRYLMKLGTARHLVEVQTVDRVVDTETLSSDKNDIVERNQVAEVVLRSRSMIALDEFNDNSRTGRFVLVENYDTVGGGIISMEGYPDQRVNSAITSTNIQSVDHRVTTAARWRSNGHRSGVLWFTGLSGAGKTTLALELERQLFLKGYQVFVLDGDNIRHGLSANLGFSPEDRAENIRRAGEVAGLFADAGMIVITAFISPYRADRDRARAVRPETFHEIHVKASLELCEQRDPKGLYQKARKGEIETFTGVTAPYEEPVKPELVLDTGAYSVSECVAQLLDYVENTFGSRHAISEGKDKSSGDSYII